jgi:hypothetical protein
MQNHYQKYWDWRKGEENVRLQKRKGADSFLAVCLAFQIKKP